MMLEKMNAGINVQDVSKKDSFFDLIETALIKDQDFDHVELDKLYVINRYHELVVTRPNDDGDIFVIDNSPASPGSANAMDALSDFLCIDVEGEQVEDTDGCPTFKVQDETERGLDRGHSDNARTAIIISESLVRIARIHALRAGEDTSKFNSVLETLGELHNEREP